MSAIVKTIVATGLSSGLGFEALKQLLQQTHSYRIILGARDIKTTNAALDKLQYDRAANAVTVLPLELSDLRSVNAFAQKSLEAVAQGKIDYLLLNAGMNKSAVEKGPHGSQWCEAAVVNHFAQHYLIHLLREKLAASKARIVVVSSGAIRNVPDTGILDEQLKGGSGTDGLPVYAGTKFIQLLGAHWWRRELKDECEVVVVSPGLIPGTGLGRHTGFKLSMDMPDAKTIPEGAQSILAGMTRTDLPEDPERIFLTSWGDWWEKDVYQNSLDRSLQDKWCPSKDEMEKEGGITA